MKSLTETLVKALRILARDIQSDDGVANAAISEAADRLAELERENAALREQVEHLIGMIEQLESDLAHFATIEAFETKKEAKP